MKRSRMIGLCLVAAFAVGAVAAASAAAEANPCGLISKNAIAKALKFTHVWESPSSSRSSTGAAGSCIVEAWQGNPAKRPRGKQAYKKFLNELRQKFSKGLAANLNIAPSYGEFRAGEWKDRPGYFQTFGNLVGTHFDPPTGGAEFATAGVRSGSQGALVEGAWWTTALPGWLQLGVSESNKRPARADFEKLAATIVPAFERVLTARSW